MGNGCHWTPGIYASDGRRLYERALMIIEKGLGPVHPWTAMPYGPNPVTGIKQLNNRLDVLHEESPNQ
jgi:hypothetical protein